MGLSSHENVPGLGWFGPWARQPAAGLILLRTGPGYHRKSAGSSQMNPSSPVLSTHWSAQEWVLSCVPLLRMSH